jgi:hypothetical protein
MCAVEFAATKKGAVSPSGSNRYNHYHFAPDP